ncbi:hypothetical protein E6H31_07210 [Candidatus Bathyarchaeota archaeon]|nr:MAG: hypothetical protein E6H31_07210 [Candidatus Bathyarchaeota archaeon]
MRRNQYLGYLDDPAVRLAVILLGSGLLLSALVADVEIMVRLVVLLLGAVQFIPILLRRR